MVFSSYEFLFCFLPAVLFVYFAVLRGRKARNLFLLIASLFFYATGEPVCVLLMIVSIAGNWLLGLAAEKYKNSGRLVVAAAVVFNLGILFFFKYLMFVLNNVNYFFHTQIPVPHIRLPIGISFFTFQALSYVIDIYRAGQSGASPALRAQRNPLNVGLYISLFPQLIAGPIVRYATIADQIQNRKETRADFSMGVNRFLCGLAKKVIIADNLALVADYAFDLADNPAVATVWLAAIAYTLQIYFDFSGYSDMAIGLGRMFGFRFLENFNYPYIAKSATEFWRRWHISLGTWFRDYLYFPLGGSRVSSKGRLVFNLFIVWGLTGLWHGANWTYICWGLIFFVLITLEKLTGFHEKLGIFSRPYALFSVVISMTVFRCADITQVIAVLKTMFCASTAPLWNAQTGFWFREHLFFFLIGILFSVPILPLLKKRFAESRAALYLYTASKCAVFLLTVAYMVSNTYSPFIYFNF